MRLLHITATHLNSVGGIPVVLRDLVNAQNQIDGFEARVLSLKANITEINSVFFDKLDGSFKKYIDSYQPDVVIFHSHYYFEYLYCYNYLLKKHIPYFIEPHGSFSIEGLKKSKFKKLISNNILLRRYMNRAKGYVFLSNSELDNSRFRTSSDIIIPNGITYEEYDKTFRDNSFNTFYYIGRYDIKEKGLNSLFDALDILEKEGCHIRFNLYGKGSKREKKYISSRIKRYEVVEVIERGPIYGDEQRRELEQYGIMILTSRHEGFPMTVLEAWKYGNPCLLSPGTNVANEAVKNCVGWKTELNSEDIAASIKKAAKDYMERRNEYIVSCKRYVRKNYCWYKIATESYDTIMKSLEK
ncbi:Glycosyltransferase involved in cell wall bisynthesis [Butyrivibrio sp. Su6]|uniref:glycosyltransferase n=1 Tax=Butyrivibrio sp. Su6 TaxID=1520810 RepID=UPI00089E9B22|nr:glycosyltransferase [Butyrivibrio sp. Su6]SEG16727.1 Glycosyltransferase involved in cell wall bisynthesis [Butyrivibrio sp. Su6]